MKNGRNRVIEMRQNSEQSGRRWIVGRWFDLFLLSNLWWPLAFLIAYSGDGFGGREGLQFWQVYFVTTPHRWITLAVVFLDRERFREQPAVYVGLLAGVVALCLGTLLATGSLTCLLAIDYVWNMWHFAAQHHGIYRLYGRMNSNSDNNNTVAIPGEKFLMRFFLLYVMTRVAGGTWSWPVWESWMQQIDGWILVIPAILIASDVTSGRWSSGRMWYLISLLSLYTGLLLAVHQSWPRIVLALTTASAIFHAMEYLALVSWSLDRRVSVSHEQVGHLAWVVKHGGLVLSAYIILLGVGGWMIENQWFHFWLTLNLMAAFLHYSYDGLIWKRPRRKRSSAMPTLTTN